jgi:hypothetical protein
VEIEITGETLIDELEIGVRLYNCLRNIYPGLKEGNEWLIFKSGSTLSPAKVKDFLHLSDAELLSYPNFGRKSLNEWKDIVRHIDNPHATIVEEKVAEEQALKRLRALLHEIAGCHKSIARKYENLADVIAPLA